MLRVLKVGGSALTDAGWVERLAAAVAAAPRPLVVVHGGGPEISDLARRLEVPVAWAGGRRVTSAAALEVAGMVLSGRINKRLVAAFVGAGGDALGISGEDGGLLTAAVAEGGALGHVGRIVAVRTKLLRGLLDLGLIPVISPISRGPAGRPLNVNADEVATAIAAALGAAELLFLTDVPGVHDGAGYRPALDPAAAAALLDGGVARDGMAVKLRAAAAAVAAGVPAARIGPLEMLGDGGAGTLIAAPAGVAA
jgi:acetylglutamate kinase